MHPLNQYRVVVVTSQQVVSLNTRSVVLSDAMHVSNISRMSNQVVSIVAATISDRNVLVLLSSG